uniref:Uncharacterized protein n=1 Tax=Kalanchoe fedtschenkoi TaxID=63787 RepID=A0A7N0U2E8_KALFE
MKYQQTEKETDSTGQYVAKDENEQSLYQPNLRTIKSIYMTGDLVVFVGYLFDYSFKLEGEPICLSPPEASRQIEIYIYN